MADTPPQIERINALTVNARNTWFVLLGALVFVGITLMGVEHIDFYGVDRATTLPLVNVEVPTRLFFAAAPILVAAIYSYFHLYLIRLWDALSDADATVNDRPLGDAITPWLITDAALYLRTQLRDEPTPSARHRLLEGSAMVLNFAIAWAFGLIVLFFLWWLSMSARTFWMTLVAGLSLFGATFVGATSLFLLRARMKEKQTGTQGHVLATIPALSALIIAVPLVIAVSSQRTQGSIGRLAPVYLVDEAVVERPAGWLPYALARDAFLDAWCARKGQENCAALSPSAERASEAAWSAQRNTALADMRRPDWSDATVNGQINWQNGDLRSAFLVGVNLRGARLSGADLSRAQMERADLRDAELEEANLSSARLERARLRTARLNGSNLQHASMEGAILINAKLDDAQMEGVHLRDAKMQYAHLAGATLNGAYMEGADLSRADLSQARLESAHMVNSTLSRTDLTDTNLALAFVAGQKGARLSLYKTNLSAARATAGAWRHVDMTAAIWDAETDFRNTFLEERTVTLPRGFRKRMNDPCQWVDGPLTDAEFHALWRWWIAKSGMLVVRWWSEDPGYREGLQASPELLARHGLTDCEPGQPFGPMPTD